MPLTVKVSKMGFDAHRLKISFVKAPNGGGYFASVDTHPDYSPHPRAGVAKVWECVNSVRNSEGNVVLKSWQAVRWEGGYPVKFENPL